MQVDIVVYIKGDRVVLGKVDVYASTWSDLGDLQFDLDRAVLLDEMGLVLHRKVDTPLIPTMMLEGENP